MKILFLIRSLEYGGAQRQLVALAGQLRRRGHRPVVAVFYPRMPLAEELRQSGVRVRSLDKAGRWDGVRFLRRLVRLIRREDPDVLHGYEEGANLILSLIKPLHADSGLVWGVRGSERRWSDAPPGLRWVTWGCRLLRRVPDRIVYNSEAALEHWTEWGYPADVAAVVPNGIDVDRFRPAREARSRVRESWGVAQDELLVGLVGRVRPQKGHPTFLRAAGSVAARVDRARFLCVGRVDARQERFARRMRRLGAELGLEGKITWEAPRRQVEEVYAALDVAISASAYGEGFPNVVGEAMACGVPCVVTDVGDSARVVGPTGRVVPSGDADAMAAALLDLLAASEEHRRRAGRRARERILRHFTVDHLAERTERVLSSVAGAAGRGRQSRQEQTESSPRPAETGDGV